MNHAPRWLLAPVLLTLAACAQQMAAPSPSPTSGPSGQVIAKVCGGGPTRAVRVLRNAEGAVGGYAAVPGIMDSPIAYYDPAGKLLTVFHIFDSDANKAAASAIVQRLAAAFPREEVVACPRG